MQDIRTALKALLPHEPLQSDEQSLEFQLRFPEDFPAFQGHFPEKKILPAVVQFLLVQVVMESALRRRLFLAGVPRGRFKTPIEPNDDIRLRLNWDSDPAKTAVQFFMDCGSLRKSQGSLLLNTGMPQKGRGK